ncbi:MAG: hypothetical protein HY898_21785 [Deltaproteobacteria bacterium]|nr:hypothetical protein [Deltaproteobacteria bacterium]
MRHLVRIGVVAFFGLAVVQSSSGCGPDDSLPTRPFVSKDGGAGTSGHAGATGGNAGTSGHGGSGGTGVPTKEVCDGVDNNANGVVDEGCACKIGESQKCYPGPPTTRNVGECKDGSQKCVQSGEFAAWGPCEGAVLPSDDIADGKDNDCNGTPDDSKCAPDQTKDQEVCADGVDNDCDGLYDCDDPDCPPCHEGGCGDGVDNDVDGKIDCLDPDCPPCTEDCANGGDDDYDGLVDCQDPDCGGPCKEVCGDAKDNDYDGLIDCYDPDCGCKETCGNGKDDDADGLVDCQDPDCQPCHETNCADGKDNDQDGLVDCADTDCPGCKEDCGNGFDDDHDGFVDGADPECMCFGGECCNGKDDDGDGWIDEGQVCANIGEPCPPGAYKECDCYCGVSRRCRPDGTWGPCYRDGACGAPVQISSHDQCGAGMRCDGGGCYYAIGGPCYHPWDCPLGQVCDDEICKPDHFHGAQCP